MIIKIRYKLFLVLALTSIASVFATALAIHWNTERNFTKYRDLVEKQHLTRFVDTVSSYYISEGSWDKITDDKDLLEIVEPRIRGNLRRPPPRRNGDNSNRDRQRGGGPRGQGARDIEPGAPRGQRPQGSPNTRGVRPDRSPIGPPPNSTYSLPNRLVLFNQSGEKISGQRNTAKIKEPILVNNGRVGWLGIANDDGPRFSPTETAFLEQERYAFFLALSVTSLMSLIIALLYSKQFETPLKHLAGLAHRLTEGEFSARSNILRKDELGELSIDLNILANTLEKNEAMREQWIADTSHELRTPVTILLGEIEALRDRIRQPSDEVLASLQEEVVHLAKLIDDLNTLSQADNKSLKFDMEELSVDDLIQDICSHAQPLVKEKGFELKLSLSVKVNIRADSTRIKQVFDNLIMNSLRYSSAPGGIHIRTKMRKKNNNECIEITLEDTPPCPSHEEINQVFERFYRTESSRNRKTGGRGLGLAICRRIVESHGGSIKAYAARSGGMGIRIQLPKI